MTSIFEYNKEEEDRKLYQAGVEQGIEQGIEQGNVLHLIGQVCKKMKKGKTIRQLNSIRKEAEDHLLLDARGGDAADSIWARDIEALTAGIQALSAQGPDRTGRLRRDSKMLGQVPDVGADMVHQDSRPMFDAIVAYWRRGKRAVTPIEIAALNGYREICCQGANPNNLNSRREIVSRVALLLMQDVHPEEARVEEKNDDGEA